MPKKAPHDTDRQDTLLRQHAAGDITWTSPRERGIDNYRHVWPVWGSWDHARPLLRWMTQRGTPAEGTRDDPGGASTHNTRMTRYPVFPSRMRHRRAGLDETWMTHAAQKHCHPSAP